MYLFLVYFDFHPSFTRFYFSLCIFPSVVGGSVSIFLSLFPSQFVYTYVNNLKIFFIYLLYLISFIYLFIYFKLSQFDLKFLDESST